MLNNVGLKLIDLVNHVESFLVSQGERSMNGAQCAYRVDLGGKCLKCAVGCLIPDSESELASVMERWAIRVLYNSVQHVANGNKNATFINRAQAYKKFMALIRKNYDLDDIKEEDLLEVLGEMQRIHDHFEMSDMGWWFERLRESIRRQHSV